jgi:hypothetical protein
MTKRVGGPLAGDVVVEIGEQLLVADVELRGEAEAEEVDVERVDGERAGERQQARGGAAARGVGAPVGGLGGALREDVLEVGELVRVSGGGPVRRPERAQEHGVDVVLGDGEATEGVVAGDAPGAEA